MNPCKSVLLAFACVSLGLGAIACQSKTDRAKEKAVTRAESFQGQLRGMPAQIDDTLNKMLATVAGQNPRREADFRAFQSSLAELRTSARDVGNKYLSARGSSENFFMEWSKDARQLSGEERLALENKIGQRISTRADALDYFEKAKTSFIKLSDSLSKIETNLAGNFSEQNSKAQDPLVQRAMIDGNDAKNYAMRLDEVLSAAVNAR